MSHTSTSEYGEFKVTLTASQSDELKRHNFYEMWFMDEDGNKIRAYYGKITVDPSYGRFA